MYIDVVKKRIKQHKKKIFLHKFTARALYFFFRVSTVRKSRFGNLILLFLYRVYMMKMIST